jgi:hypothetical protein
MQNSAYGFFTTLGVGILLLVLIELVIGREAFLYFLQMFWPIGEGLILTLCVLALIAVILAFQCRRDPVLYVLGIITIPYTIFAADNVLYFFYPLVVANGIVVVVSIVYSLATIAAGLRWFISGNLTPQP